MHRVDTDFGGNGVALDRESGCNFTKFGGKEDRN
jgi:hypothetical protein